MSRSHLRRLIAADAVGIAAAFAAAWLVFDAPLLFEDAGWEPYPLLAAGVAGWIAAARAAGHYADSAPGWGQDVVRVSGLMTVGAWAVSVASWLTGKPDPDVRQLLAFWALAIAGIVLARRAARAGGAGGRPDLTAAPGPRRTLLTRPGPLAITDGAVLLVVLIVGRRWVDEPLPADSTALAWVFLALAIPAWIAVASALGHYEPARGATVRDLRDTVVLASWGAWLLVALSPFTGEIDPDINQLLVVWTLTIAAVTAGRLLVAPRALRVPGWRRAPSG